MTVESFCNEVPNQNLVSESSLFFNLLNLLIAREKGSQKPKHKQFCWLNLRTKFCTTVVLICLSYTNFEVSFCVGF